MASWNHSGAAQIDSYNSLFITHILSQRGLRGLPIAWKLLINNESPKTPYQIVIVAVHFNLWFFTSAPSTRLPGSNFSDKTPQGRWALTKVTHASATFEANHNSIFHLKGCFTNFVLFKCMLWAVFEVSPLKTVFVGPPPVISDCKRATPAAPLTNMTRGVHYKMLSRQRHAAVITWASQRATKRKGLIWEITWVKIAWFVLMCGLMSETCIKPQGAEPT